MGESSMMSWDPVDDGLDRFPDDSSLASLDRSSFDSFDSFENISSFRSSLALRFVPMPIDDAVIDDVVEGVAGGEAAMWLCLTQASCRRGNPFET